MSIMVGVGRGAQSGVLIKNAEALERFEKIDTLVIDKTGTLTEGKPRVTAIRPIAGMTENELLRLAASVERASEHPLASAIVQSAVERKLELTDASDFDSPVGKGVTGKVGGKSLAIGNRRFLNEIGIDAAALDAEAEQLREDGATAIFVAIDGKPAGILGIADPVKATTPGAIRALQEAGVKIVMLTGDNWTTARAVAKRLKIDEVEAEILPQDKGKIVTRLREQGRVVAMAGDGVNDAPALAAADVGIAMGTGTDVAIESAGVTLLKGDLQGIVRGRRLSAATMRNIRQNLFFAFIYNALGVPIAAGALYPFFGVLLSPIIAAAAMALSSVSVILNSLRLRGVNTQEQTTANRFYSIIWSRKGAAWTSAAAVLAISLGSILVAYAPKFITSRETGPVQVEKPAPLPAQQATPTPREEANSAAMKQVDVTAGREREVNATTTTAAAPGELLKKKLPNGVELIFPNSGVEAKLLAFLEAEAKPTKRATWFDFDRLQFETGKATPQASSREQLQNIAHLLAAYPSVKVTIAGYTDELGNPGANRGLSQSRADSVRRELIRMGLAASRLGAKGYGESHPVATNDTEEGRAKNRRISLGVIRN